MSIEKKSFGTNIFGDAVDCFTLTNTAGMRVRIMTHGGAILSIETPDRQGVLADVVLGHDRAEDYTKDTPYFGSITGRVANRIDHGAFTLDGQTYQLNLNDNGKYHLHGGERGFDKQIWTATILEAENALTLSYLSPDGEENYPGNLSVSVTYTLTEENELKIHYEAETDQATPLNLTNHTYFNLAGHDAGKCGEQVITLYADRFVVTDDQAIPTGEIRSVENTPLDFRTPTALGERIGSDYEQIRFGIGYDHTYCLPMDGELTRAAHVVDPQSGRVLEAFTTEPGVQLYSGNYLDGTACGKGGFAYPFRGGFCLETQHWPDSPNQPTFPNTILRPGETFTSETVYRFSTQER